MARIAILIDNPRSWFVPYGEMLRARLVEREHEVQMISDPQQLPEGDIAFFLSCEQLIGQELRARNRHNIVIHASALPKGKGWSPMAWQILEGKREIPLTLFEAADAVDAGEVYMRDTIVFEGNELIDELRAKEGEAIVALALAFVETYPRVSGTPQEGEESFYMRRSPEDSKLDPARSIADQFDLLRVVDNERYPAFFEHRGETYVLKIYKKPPRV